MNLLVGVTQGPFSENGLPYGSGMHTWRPFPFRREAYPLRMGLPHSGPPRAWNGEFPVVCFTSHCNFIALLSVEPIIRFLVRECMWGCHTRFVKESIPFALGIKEVYSLRMHFSGNAPLCDSHYYLNTEFATKLLTWKSSTVVGATCI
ncbi:hypothetical protein M758_UG131600 [Ceratodon purpureus]|nr:hypothetical protein M758_UG131600 [Ceratodon purpureus]